MEKINNNAYKIDIHQEYGGSNSIQAPNLRLNYLQEGEDDMNTHGGFKSMDSTILEGPMTRGRLRKLQEEVHQEMGLLKGQERLKFKN
ncbi:hypothetical protein CR513_40011, partial [Mucuna pruriens]